LQETFDARRASNGIARAKNFYEVFRNKWTIQSVTDAIIIFRDDANIVLSSKVNTESIVCGQLEGEK
jgi:hypothetical protein